MTSATMTPSSPMPSALDLAHYSQLAYEPLEAVRAALPGAGVIQLDRDESQAYVIETPQETVVAFRGTQVTGGFSMTDVLRNAKLRLVPSGQGLGVGQRGRLHRGYKEAVDAIAGDLAQAVIQAKRPLIYTGHSLGGAMASYARTLAPHPDRTVTFGAPKVGDRKFVRANERHHLLRYMHARDIAPKHATVFQGYRHGGEFRKIARDGTVMARKWRWYDDVILPSSLIIGTLDHRIGEYVAKLRGAEV